MSYEFIYENAGVQKKLNTAMQSKIADYVSNCYSSWQEARLPLLRKSETLIKEIFFKNDFANFERSGKNWKAKVRICKAFMLYQTLKAYIWRNIYAKPGSMFDVSGENTDSDNNSNKQKAALTDVFERMKLSKCLDTIIDNSLLYGDLIAFVGWKKNTKQVRRRMNLVEKIFALAQSGESDGFVTEEVVTYDNPYVFEVNPVNFVYDIAQMGDWDSCPKILKSFKTPEDIMNNTLYTLNGDCKDMLNMFAQGRARISGENDNIDNQSPFNLKDEVTNGNMLEVLEHWGDIRLSDGELLKNMHVVVLARKFVIRFEPNKFIENPFVYAHYLLDPETKRPISPLQSIYDLAMMQESLYNKTLNMQALNENPPIYAPNGFFSEKEIDLCPGKVITYDPNLYQNVPLTPMSFNSNIYLQDILELDKIIAEVSGIFPNMSGQLDRGNATATEINIKTQGQNVRLAMILDIINQDLILPIVEKTAALLANFKFAPEALFINKDGKNESMMIDNGVRQGYYQYSYSDRSSLFDKMNNADSNTLVLEQFGKVMPLNWTEIFKWYWEQKGVDNPERFLQAPQPQGVNPAMLAGVHPAVLAGLAQAKLPNLPQQPQPPQPSQSPAPSDGQ